MKYKVHLNCFDGNGSVLLSSGSVVELPNAAIGQPLVTAWLEQRVISLFEQAEPMLEEAFQPVADGGPTDPQPIKPK
jgi:hypothetical protein